MSDRAHLQSANKQATLLVVDGHSLAFRAYFALPVENFSTSTGQPTNAVWGFATMLAQVIEAEHPEHLAVAFDVKGGTFRNKLLPQYKGTRDAAPEDLLSQLPLIKQMLKALGVTYIEQPGFEGDDIIGTLASMGERAGFRTLVLSGDRDAFQLIDDSITVLYPGHHFKDLKHMTAQAVMDKYHVSPQQYPDLAALRGETADNIPGVPGVGDGFAGKWINQYGSLEGIIAHSEEISGKKGEALRDNIDQVRLNRKVNALVRDLNLGVDIHDCTFGTVNADDLNDLFTTLEFGQRTKSRVLGTFGTVASVVASGQHSEHTEEPSLTEVSVSHLSDAQTLRAWIDDHIDADEPVGSVDGHNVETPVGPVDNAVLFGDALRRAWVLHTEPTDHIAGDRGHSSLRVLIQSRQAVADFVAEPDDEFIETLRALIAQRHATMVVHGYKEQLHRLHGIGIELAQPGFDTKLAGYLVEPDFHAATLEQAAGHFLDIHLQPTERPVQGELNLEPADGSSDDQDDVLAISHISTVAALAAKLAPMLDERRQYGLLRSIELPVSHVLYSMERNGANVDAGRLTRLRDQFGADARQAQEIAWQSAGSQVNLQSPKQLQTVLFEDMGLKPGRRTKSGSYTTNAAALQDLYVRSVNNERANTFLGALLQHRETNKLKQIVQTLIDATDADDGKIHTTFEQTVAATGRLSSVDPNLQNIPNRNASGREIRSAFVPSSGFESLLSCDYSQVELRLMADFSGDEALIEAFRSGTDFHKYVASLVYQLPVSEISADQRSHVKAMSYGLAYGLSTYGLARQLKISPAAADVLKEQYFSTFGKVHTYLESLVATAKTKGYTQTMYGRRRYFPALKSTNRVARDAAERGALNAPIQGSAADIMKLAMIRAQRAMDDAHVHSRIILQIHDELVIEVAPGEAEQVSALVRDAMEHAVELAVPLDVSVGIGSDWQLAAH